MSQGESKGVKGSQGESRVVEVSQAESRGIRGIKRNKDE